MDNKKHNKKNHIKFVFLGFKRVIRESSKKDKNIINESANALKSCLHSHIHKQHNHTKENSV
jgi:hypothetical protein